MNQRIGFIGIGNMGAGIVKNLRKKEIEVSFTARENQRALAAAERLTGFGARRAVNYENLAEESDVVMLCLPDTPTVEHILLSGEGIGPSLREGQIIVDLSTSYPPSTRRLCAIFKDRGIDLLDAPLTGSKVQAEEGILNVMCGGSKEAFDVVKPVFEAFSAHVFHVGESGSGHAIKLINNYFGQASLMTLCEILPFAKKYGVSLQALYDVISVSGGNNATFQGMMPRLMKRDFSINFQQKLARKDVHYMNKLARETGTPTPMAAAVLSLHDMATARGYGDEDISAMLKFFEEFAGSG